MAGRASSVQAGQARAPNVLAENETAARMALRSGGEEDKKAARFQRRSYHHPDRIATRKATAARERMLRAIIAFNGLEPSEQALFAGQLFDIMRSGEPVPPFCDIETEAGDWASLALLPELRAYALAVWRAMPAYARSRFLTWARRQAEQEVAA